MRGNPMGTTHIFVVGLEVALALMFGAIFFQEHLTFPKIGAVTLILVGLILLKKIG